MTLLSLISLLDGNIDVTVKADEVLIEFMSGGINSVSSDVTSRLVSKWTIDGSTRITVELEP